MPSWGGREEIILSPRGRVNILRIAVNANNLRNLNSWYGEMATK